VVLLLLVLLASRRGNVVYAKSQWWWWWRWQLVELGLLLFVSQLLLGWILVRVNVWASSSCRLFQEVALRLIAHRDPPRLHFLHPFLFLLIIIIIVFVPRLLLVPWPMLLFLPWRTDVNVRRCRRFARGRRRRPKNGSHLCIAIGIG